MSRFDRAKLLVQKYGGSSVATPEHILKIADRITQCRLEAPHMVVAVSAMGKTTDQLIGMAGQVSSRPVGREMDQLLACGETIAVSLLGLALQDRNVPAVSLTAAQCGIRTDGSFNRARIANVETGRLLHELESGRVVVVAGFQGITSDHEVTTLGRGGGDITGAALAAALNAPVCEICTDVDGVYTADPHMVDTARLVPEMSYEEAIELAASGAKVLHPRAAEICMQFDVPIHVRCSFHRRPGTWIRGGVMESAAVVGITSDKKIAKVTLLEVKDEPGVAATVFRDLAREDVNVRLIIQAAASHDRNRITFVTDNDQVDRIRELEVTWRRRKIVGEVQIELDVAKIAIVGSRIASTPGLAARMFTALARNNVNIDCISTSEMKVSCVIGRSDLEQAVRAVHAEFFGTTRATAPRAKAGTAGGAAARRAGVGQARKAVAAAKKTGAASRSARR
ncbi:MAG: aspartate kinase [Acidobacteria bacterium]|nr:aspartate kinase [Acidobacteriota bacterium]